MSTYHLCDMTPAFAEAHTRRTHSVPDHVMLGWTPYRFTVTRDAIAECAFHTEPEFAAWLAHVWGPPAPEWSDCGDGLRVSHFTAREGR